MVERGAAWPNPTPLAYNSNYLLDTTLGPMSPDFGTCGIFWWHITTTSFSFASTISYAPGYGPSTPNPYAPPATMRDHEMVHVQNVRDYINRLNSVLNAVDPARCVCHTCLSAKLAYVSAASTYYWYSMNERNEQFDCDQYHDPDVCLAASVDRGLLPGLQSSMSAAGHAVNAACR
jgi:hypothetical protein